MTQLNSVESSPSKELARRAAEAGLALQQKGTGRTVLLLHGGGGPLTVAGFAEALSAHFHVVTPTHPGFNGTPRPAALSDVRALAGFYGRLLEDAGLEDVLAIGFSMGGWIASELSLAAPRTLAGIVLADAAGITVPGQTVLDVFAISPSQIADFSYHTPDRFRIDPSKMSEQQQAGMRANFATLAAYARSSNMQDPTLRERLSAVKLPALAVWGESDRVVYPDYGRAFAAAFPNGRFELISACGHMPQLEQPQRLQELVEGFERDLR